MYLEELVDKIKFGRSRVKKRDRVVEKSTSVNVKNRLKGTFVEYETYKKD